MSRVDTIRDALIDSHINGILPYDRTIEALDALEKVEHELVEFRKEKMMKIWYGYDPRDQVDDVIDELLNEDAVPRVLGTDCVDTHTD